VTELYWFRSDLRLDDNPGLYFHAGAASLLCVYLWPPQVPWCNVNGIGVHRLRFLHETVRNCNRHCARGARTCW